MQFKADIGHDSRAVIADSRSQAGQDLFVVAMTQGKIQGKWLEIGAGDAVWTNNTWLLEHRFHWHGDSLDITSPFASQKQIMWQAFYSRIKSCFPGDPPPDWIIDPKDIGELPPHIQKDFYEIHHYAEVMKNASDQVIVSRSSWPMSRPAANLIITDAIFFDYSQLSGHYDYLQVDLDCGRGSIKCLQNVMKYHRPSVVTYEHDFFRNTEDSASSRSMSRSLMHDLGYILVANDVTCEPNKGWTVDNNPIYFEDWYAHPDFIDIDVITAYRSVESNLRPKYYHEILFAQENQATK